MYAAPSASARLAAVGLHYTDPRYPFALAAVRAAPPEKRATAAERFRTAGPDAVPLPNIALLDTFSIVLPASLATNVHEVRLLLCAEDTTWAARAEILRLWLCLRRVQGLSIDHTRTTRAIIAAAFEGLGYREIGCVEHAAYLAILQHATWREAARAFLDPIATTWLRDWLDDQPEFREIAHFAQLDHPDVPAYLT